MGMIFLDRPATFSATRGNYSRTGLIATPPSSTEVSLQQRLRDHAANRWPQISKVHIRHRAGF